jgi:hypothetical protein
VARAHSHCAWPAPERVSLDRLTREAYEDLNAIASAVWPHTGTRFSNPKAVTR